MEATFEQVRDTFQEELLKEFPDHFSEVEVNMTLYKAMQAAERAWERICNDD